MRILAFLVATTATGCLAPPTTADEHDDGDADPIAMPAPVASGTYQVRSDIDLTIEAVLPEPAADLVGTLRDFEQAPAETMFDVAEDAGVPAVGTIRDALPSYLEDKLYGWIDAEIAKVTVAGVPVTQIAGDVVALAETALTHFALDSELTLGAGGTATHALKTLDLTPTGLDVTFAVGELPSNVVVATPSYSAAGASLSIGDHTYGLAYGDYMWRAFDGALVAQYGTNVRDTLALAVNCPSLAHTIANKCALGVCVGHETELVQICDAGIDEIVKRAYEKVAALRFDAVHFAAGSATLVDANQDGTAETLASGVWTAEINAGLGLRHAPATFTASR